MAQSDKSAGHGASQSVENTLKPAVNPFSDGQQTTSSDSHLLSRLREVEESLAKEKDKNRKFRDRVRDAMSNKQASIEKWSTEVNADNDPKIKEATEEGTKKLIEAAAEDNGVWKLLVAASALHERQTHNLDQLRIENNELKSKVDGMYGSVASRVVGEKSKAETQLARDDVERDNTGATDSMWSEFAKDIGGLF